MIELSENDIQSILAGHPHHPDDREILYAPDSNTPWIAPLVKSERIKAVVVPVQSCNRIAFHTAVAATVTADEIAHLLEQDLYALIDDQLLNHDNHTLVSNYHMPDICYEQMMRTGKALEPLRAEGQSVLIEALASLPGSAGRGRFPNLHSDEFSANITLKGNAMKFLIGEVSEKEREFIDQYGNGLYSQFQRALAEKFSIKPDWDSRLRSFETGDLIIFNKRLLHCSDFIAPKGHLAFNAYFKNPL